MTCLRLFITLYSILPLLEAQLKASIAAVPLMHINVAESKIDLRNVSYRNNFY